MLHNLFEAQQNVTDMKSTCSLNKDFRVTYPVNVLNLSDCVGLELNHWEFIYVFVISKGQGARKRNFPALF